MGKIQMLKQAEQSCHCFQGLKQNLKFYPNDYYSLPIIFAFFLQKTHITSKFQKKRKNSPKDNILNFKQSVHHNVRFRFCMINTYHSVRLVAMAATNPRISKLSSLAEQRASPLITGISDRLTYRPVASPEEWYR